MSEPLRARILADLHPDRYVVLDDLAVKHGETYADAALIVQNLVHEGYVDYRRGLDGRAQIRLTRAAAA